ncbi:MAG TPA: hypothetical protein VFP98_10065 [Candidatus Polarisedimenticolia bacterium]|nr:hypothetical protein [Candidatus Polarisedimenticolia bacterium]
MKPSPVVLALASLAAAGAVAAALWISSMEATHRETAPPGPAAQARDAGRRVRPPAADAGRILVQVLRGSMVDSAQEITVTTIFREQSFSVLAGAELAGASEDELRAHVRDIFSLKEVTSLGTSVVPLSGGEALLDDGRRLRVRIRGESMGDRAFRLVVSEVRDGKETVASSVIAREGRTVVLAGPPAAGEPGRGADGAVSFLCLTPIAGEDATAPEPI